MMKSVEWSVILESAAPFFCFFSFLLGSDSSNWPTEP